MLLWLNLWDKWCYAMSDKMMWIVLSWVYYTYIIYRCAFVYLYLFRNVITHSLYIVCVWILWWFRSLSSWEQMIRWMKTLKNLVLEDAETQCSNKMWYWGMNFCINCMKFWTYNFYHFCFTCWVFSSFCGVLKDFVLRQKYFRTLNW